MYKTLPQGYFGSLSSSDSTTLSSNTFEVSNIYNFHFIEVYFLNAFVLFAAILINAFKAISMSIYRN